MCVSECIDVVSLVFSITHDTVGSSVEWHWHLLQMLSSWLTAENDKNRAQKFSALHVVVLI